MTNHLIEAIHQGGPLADWFRRASLELRAAVEQALREGGVGAFVDSVSATAREEVGRGVSDSPLTVLPTARLALTMQSRARGQV